jgi:hypothetical protein
MAQADRQTESERRGGEVKPVSDTVEMKILQAREDLTKPKRSNQEEEEGREDHLKY